MQDSKWLCAEGRQVEAGEADGLREISALSSELIMIMTMRLMMMTMMMMTMKSMIASYEHQSLQVVT